MKNEINRESPLLLSAALLQTWFANFSTGTTCLFSAVISTLFCVKARHRSRIIPKTLALRVVAQCRWIDSLTRRLLPRRAIHHCFFAALSEKGKDDVWVSTYCALQGIQSHWQTLDIFAFLALAPASNFNLIYLGAKLQSCHKQYATHTLHVVSKQVKETSGSCCRYCANVSSLLAHGPTCKRVKSHQKKPLPNRESVIWGMLLRLKDWATNLAFSQSKWLQMKLWWAVQPPVCCLTWSGWTLAYFGPWLMGSNIFRLQGTWLCGATRVTLQNAAICFQA